MLKNQLNFEVGTNQLINIIIMNKKVLSIMFILSLTVSVFAQDKEDRKGNPNPELQYAVTASKVASYGYLNNDALSLLSAANILIAHPTSKLVPEKVESGTADSKKTKENEVIVDLDVNKLIADAIVLAKDDDNILALANTVKSSIPATTRSAVGGPKIAEDRVNANDYDIYYIRFYGEELAEVAVIGDGDTDLDLYIYDDSGHLIESDTDYSDDCYVSWYPKWTGTFKVKVKNRGNVYNHYVLATN